MVGTVLGTFYHFYYTNLERFIPKVTVKTTAIKILLDQTLVSPVTLFTFYCGMDYLEGKPFEACEAELKEKFLKTFAVSVLLIKNAITEFRSEILGNLDLVYY